MKQKHTTHKNALKIARELMQEDGIKRPVIAFVEHRAWEQIKNKDDVAVINADDEVSLDYFMDKAVVFCMYQAKNISIIDVLAKQWYDFLGGDSVLVSVSEWEDEK